jgi:hypothetical protein
MKIYNAYYSKNGLFVYLIHLKANNIREAKNLAKIHQQKIAEIKNSDNVKIEVNLIHI